MELCFRPITSSGLNSFLANPWTRLVGLVGAIGVSGDGIDQDDMIAFLGVHEAAAQLGGFGNAAPMMRADTLEPQGTRLRYINCPVAPYIGSDEQNVCAGK